MPSVPQRLKVTVNHLIRDVTPTPPFLVGESVGAVKVVAGVFILTDRHPRPIGAEKFDLPKLQEVPQESRGLLEQMALARSKAMLMREQSINGSGNGNGRHRPKRSAARR